MEIFYHSSALCLKQEHLLQALLFYFTSFISFLDYLILINTAVNLYVLGPIRRDWSCTVILTYRQNFWTSKTSVPRGDGHGQEVLSRTCSTKHGRSDLKSCQSRMNSSTALSVLWEDRIKPDSALRIYGQYPSTLYYRVIRSPKTCSALVEGSIRGIKPPSAQSCRHGCLPSGQGCGGSRWGWNHAATRPQEAAVT